MQKITPFLWFIDNAEEAVNLYVSLLPDSKVINKRTMGDDVPGPKGKVMTISFQLAGQDFMALNGGPVDTFNLQGGPVSLFVTCDTQEEIDKYYDTLKEGGTEIQCGWVTDKYGITWQIVPTILEKLMGDPDPKKAQAVTQCFMKMKKFNIAELQKAHDEA